MPLPSALWEGREANPRQKIMREMPDLDPNPSIKLGPDIKKRVGQQLRVIYSEVMHQDIPDRCIEILKRLDDVDDGPRQ